MPVFVLVLIVIFKFMLGFEKDKFRYKKDLILDISIDVIVYYILYYLLGILIGFARNENFLTVYGITKFIIPLIISIIGKEYLRYGLLRKCGNNKKLINLTTVMFIFMDITYALSMYNFNSQYNTIVFLGINFLPSVTRNIYLSYISMKEGYKPGIGFLLLYNLPMYILPIIPNPSVYMKSVIDFIVPAWFLFKSLNFYRKNII